MVVENKELKETDLKLSYPVVRPMSLLSFMKSFDVKDFKTIVVYTF